MLDIKFTDGLLYTHFMAFVFCWENTPVYMILFKNVNILLFSFMYYDIMCEF